MGWKTTFTAPGAWVRYNAIDFNKKKFKNLVMNARSDAEGLVEIRSSSVNGPLVCKVKVGKNGSWKEISSKLKKRPQGTQDLFIILTEGKDIDIDWISFR